MDKKELESLISKGYTNVQIADICGCSRATVCNWKKKYGLSRTYNKQNISDGTKLCNICNKVLPLDTFSKQGIYYAPACKSCSKSSRRFNRYKRLQNALKEQNRDFSCESCGYNKNLAALQFHHFTKEKNYEIGNFPQSRSEQELQYELSICKVLCSNCHFEEHNPELLKESIL